MTACDRLLLMHGMKRSGNHAIGHWFLPQLQGAYFNNLVPLGDILRGRPMPAPQPFAAWREAQAQRRGERIERLLVTLEDHDLRFNPFVDIDIPTRHLLVLRDPRQVFSSRIRKAFRVEMPAYPRQDGPVMQRAVALWKQHARCFLGIDDGGGDRGRVAILFEAWLGDAAYRAAISSELGVPFDDTGFGKVGTEGGGSSFDGTRFDGRGHLMSVTDRVSALEPHERAVLDAVFRDRELCELGEAVLAAEPRAQLVLEAGGRG